MRNRNLSLSGQRLLELGSRLKKLKFKRPESDFTDYELNELVAERAGLHRIYLVYYNASGLMMGWFVQSPAGL